MVFAGRPELVSGRILSGKRGPGYSRLPPVPAFAYEVRPPGRSCWGTPSPLRGKPLPPLPLTSLTLALTVCHSLFQLIISVRRECSSGWASSVHQTNPSRGEPYPP